MLPCFDRVHQAFALWCKGSGVDPKRSASSSTIGGFSGSAEDIPPWISNELKSSTLLQSKLAKLQRSGFDEQHLFLFVEMSGAPFSVYDNLSSEAAIPAATPELATITHPWLFPIPGFGSYLTWQQGGWRRLATPLAAG
jgi:hypothetical protein